MEEIAPRRVAVVMGDIVGSENMRDVTALHRIFNDEVAAVNRRHVAQLVSPLTITLGDEFQGFVSALAPAALIARELRHALLLQAIDCRFAVGAAVVRTPINPERAWNMMGPGLSATRDKLEAKSDLHRYRFHLPDDAMIEPLAEAVGAGLASIERGWTTTQRQIVIRLLDGTPAAEIARERGVGLNGIYKARRSAAYDLYGLQWQALVTVLAAIDAQPAP